MRYMQDNEVAKGYLLKALNFLIEEKHITSDKGKEYWIVSLLLAIA